MQALVINTMFILALASFGSPAYANVRLHKTVSYQLNLLEQPTGEAARERLEAMPRCDQEVRSRELQMSSASPMGQLNLPTEVASGRPQYLDPNPPAEVPSPSLLYLDPSSAMQPPVHEGRGNPNPPASIPSPYLQMQQTGGSRQPPVHEGRGNPNPPAEVPSPSLFYLDPSSATPPR